MSPASARSSRSRRAARMAAEMARWAALPTVAVVSLALLILLVWLGIRAPGARGETRDILPLLQDQATGALSVIVLGSAAGLYFRLRYAQAKRRYLEPFAAMSGGHGRSAASDGRSGLLAEAVEPLLAQRPPRSMLVVSPPDSVPPDIVTLLAPRLVRRRLTPIVVDAGGAGPDANVPALARSNFVERVAAATGDQTRANRLLERESRRGRVVILVTGLDALGEAKPRASRRAAITALLRSCLAERVPFVAVLTGDLAPTLSGVATVRTGGQAQADDLAALVTSRLRQQGLGVTEQVRGAVRAALGPAPAGDPWALTVAADVVVRRVRNGADPADAARDVLVSNPSLPDKMAWLCEHALNVPLSEAAECCTPAADALRLLGRQAHHREEFTITWSDVTITMDPDEALRFAAGVAALSRKGVIAGGGNVADPHLGFTHREWLVFAGALGMGLEPRWWANLLSPGAPAATLEALVEALVLPRRDRSLQDQPVLDVLDYLKDGDVQDISLDMIISVVAALQTSGRELNVRERELAILSSAWQVATDASRLLFLATIEPHPAFASFLWTQVTPPYFETNSFRVRRAIAVRLGRMGPVAWGVLGPVWVRTVKDAAGADLSPLSRLTPTWGRVGIPLASLGWTLPTLVLHLDGKAGEDGRRLLADAVAVVTGSHDGAGPGPLDPGLEISLAEGFKMASSLDVPPGSSPGRTPPWREEATLLLARSRSWVSRQALHQATALCGWAAGVSGGSSRSLGSGREHAFVREAMALAHRSRLEREIWLDDVEALHDGGLALSGQAHRLLGLTTLLIDLCESMAAKALDGLRAGEAVEEARREWESHLVARVEALTSSKLPRCFTSARHTRNLTDGRCRCEFQLCGRAEPGSAGHRRISHAFAERALSTAGARRALGRERAFVRRRFADIWRYVLDRTPVDLPQDTA
ncbi:MAG TPA: hypothetical protein VFE49_06320 [Jiangellaceae bacterium]|nr:hypothetical protein [Jiangellaceae bacterium]